MTATGGSWIDRRARAVAGAVPRVTDLEIVSGAGSYLVDRRGQKILDLATGIGVMALGHGHPEVRAAIHAQTDALQHVCAHLATYEPYVAVCEQLGRVAPHGDPTQAMLVNSGAEAVENAVKIARQATGRPAVLCFTGGYHGRTLLTMTLTSRVAYKRGCGPFAPDVYRLPYPDRLRFGEGLDEAAFVERELARLDLAFTSTVHPHDLACVVIEVVQGEGGIVACPGAWLRGLRERCTQHGIALVCDEVQSGIGRTGAWAAWQHHGVTPDLTTFAKALGGGLPLAAVVGSAALFDKVAPGTIGGTFGGNPIACAAANAVLRVIERDQLCARAADLGARTLTRLRAFQETAPGVLDVRGVGLMLAIELASADAAQRVCATALERGVLAITAGPEKRAIRLLPPLNIEEGELAEGLDVLESIIAEETV